ncbi:MAG: PAS domain S-box protein [Desulfatiglandaceae bacterium]
MAKRTALSELENRIKALEEEIRKPQGEEKILQESEKKCRNILDSIEEGFFEVDFAGDLMFFNDALCGILGYSREELLGMNNRSYTTPETAKRMFQIFNQIYRTGNPEKITNYEVIRKGGKRRVLEISASLMRDPADHPVGFYGVVRDVTERKQAEEALRKRLAYEKMLADISAKAVMVENIGEFLGECLEIMGGCLEVSRIYIFEHRHESETMDNTFEWIAEGITPQKQNLQGIRSDSASWWVEMLKSYRVINFEDIEDIPGKWEKKVLRSQDIKSVLAVPLFIRDGYYGFIGFDVCQTPRKWLEEDVDLLKTTAQIIARTIETKKAEEALRESEEKYRLLIENANDAIFVIQDEEIKFPNPKAREIGMNAGIQLERVPFIHYVHPEDKQIVLERHRKRLHGEKISNNHTFRVMKKDGEVMWAELNAVLINWDGKPATLNFLRDITPQKQLEARLQQAHKMEALGTLAGGIAHDFNNLLMGIQGRASLMLMDPGFSDSHYEDLRGIEAIVQTGTELTKQLLGFARKGKYEVRPTNINRLLEKTSQMFGRTNKEIKIHSKYAQDIRTVAADKGQIEQVLLNLYVNAWQAMPGGGDLYLQTENARFNEKYSGPYQVHPGRYVKISVTDTGMGMDKATQERIFEPFFTTKKMGRGTGLGLASAYGIIKNHGGMINVYSEKGRGTTFSVYLPASGKNVVEEKAPSEPIPKGGETVLLVDDEEMILSIGEKILKRMGYGVMPARSGKEAIETYEKNKDTIDIVVLDMIMPEIGGGEIYDRLKEINPGVKVLLSSGYSVEGMASEILKRGCNGFIQKPFRMRELSQKIREIVKNR